MKIFFVPTALAVALLCTAACNRDVGTAADDKAGMDRAMNRMEAEQAQSDAREDKRDMDESTARHPPSTPPTTP